MSMEYPRATIQAGTMRFTDLKRLCAWYLLDRSYGHIVAMWERNLSYVHITIPITIEAAEGLIHQNYEMALIVQEVEHPYGKLKYQLEFYDAEGKKVNTVFQIRQEPIKKPSDADVMSFL